MVIRQGDSPLCISVPNVDITVLVPPGDPFAVPRLDDVLHVSPREIVKMRRRRCEGRVLAVWSKDRFLIVFRLNLSRAAWRMKKHSFVPVPLETPEKTCATQILLDKDGRGRLDQSFFGKLITLRGIVRSLPAVGIALRKHLLKI